MKQEKLKSAILIFKNSLTSIKKLNRYDELLFIKGRIEICNKNKAKALAFKNLLISIEADSTANALNSEIQEFDYLFN
ncbi:hypothetical protein OZY43_05885 [Lactobacillus sp. ESL0785]|uniref:hypothetical protein n=1 Tax=Lactobacillus sp. ESL0785 TaxID=2983232 RepID=UPI0023F910F0|nr:hypothetical protein [Lactobacillus sp. ESL0785]WEV70471.1 hypothetical protein OZY43_05885 [Lactobacillus sp. ESL0785]